MPKNTSGSAAPPSSASPFEVRGDGFHLKVDHIPDRFQDRVTLILRIVGNLAVNVMWPGSEMGSPQRS
ncbi:hypothetical protein SO3561_09182 [Streptomyces olivochromogenes]|uniref:Uncharacterized protein n=1 Tax=Streptomyces olivochromogenes TaxID=1963 RepID=A0A250VUA2_STROL|nr:hypothetical protein SO3561_09182 [Streptomyces olivochromogenes]